MAMLVVVCPPVTHADDTHKVCDSTLAKQGHLGSGLKSESTCEYTTPGSPGADGGSGGGGGVSDACHHKSGVRVPCWNQYGHWSDTYQSHCQTVDMPSYAPPSSFATDEHGNPLKYAYRCQDDADFFVTHILDRLPDTPPKEGTDPVTTVRTAIATLDLQPPTIGIGAYIYDNDHTYGLSWWVGAPMWLWIDTDDSRQWGDHTLTASLDEHSITATITPHDITYDTGDGATTTCHNKGTPRPWNPRSPLNQHSPSNCEHTYQHTNTLGDPHSRYTITATVTWNITWRTTDHQSGSFTMTTTSTDNPTVHIGQLRPATVIDPTRR